MDSTPYRQLFVYTLIWGHTSGDYTLIIIHTKTAINLYALSGEHVSTSVSLQALVLYIKGARKILFLPQMRGSHPGTLLPSRLLHTVARTGQRVQLVLKEPKNLGKNMFVSASNERHLSGDTGTILEYTNVTGPNQSGLSWD